MRLCRRHDAAVCVNLKHVAVDGVETLDPPDDRTIRDTVPEMHAAQVLQCRRRRARLHALKTQVVARELCIVEDVPRLIARIAPYKSGAVCKHLRVDQSRRVDAHLDVRRIDPAGLVNVEMLADGAGLVRRNTRYEMGDILYDTQLTRHDLRLECVQAGTTAATLQDLSGVHLGQSITDGTVVWRVKRLYTIDGDMFEIDEDGGIMQTAEPHYSVNYELDEDGNIMPKAM